MIYRKCKCGEHESWSSGMPNYPCQGCEKCNTTLASHPKGHEELQPHDFVEIETITRYKDSIINIKKIRQCKICLYQEKIK